MYSKTRLLAQLAMTTAMSKEHINRFKKQMTNWENCCHIRNKGLIFYKEFLQMNKTKMNPSGQKICVGNLQKWCIKTGSTLLAISGIKLKTTMQNHCSIILTKMTKNGVTVQGVEKSWCQSCAIFLCIFHIKQTPSTMSTPFDTSSQTFS